MIHFVSVRVGQKYGPEYTAVLHDMVARNLSKTEHAHWQITDDPASLPEGVNPIPHDPELPGWWQKVRLFSADMPWGPGERVFYLDLDVCVTGRLEDLVERKGIMRDTLWPCFNSSVMVWDHGEHRAVWESFDPGDIDLPGRKVPRECLPAGQINGGDQEWITEAAPDFPTLPADWCVSYRDAKAWPPSQSKVVVFHGDPKPADVTTGWVPNVWKIGGYTSLPEMNGVNVDNSVILANIRSAISRDLDWFSGFGARERAAVICAPGPSLRDALPDIRAQKRMGGRIISLNNALGFLVANGITPDAHVMLDARPENVAFVADAPETTTYFLASQCAPELFDALADREVVIWHSHIGPDIEEIVEPFACTHPILLVPGGGTVGLRALNLAFYSGYRKIHVYGMDGSYADDGEHHVTAQALNDGETTVQVVLGDAQYRCSLWMARQAEEFQSQYRSLRRQGAAVFLHGRGLLPDMARMLRDEERRAA